MNEVQLRRKFDKEVGAPDKELLWKWLKEDHYVGMMCRGEIEWDEFTDEADRLAKRQWQISGRVKPPGRAARTIVDVDLDSYEKECAQTAALYLAKKAANLPEVRRFRQERLGGKLLTTEEAEEFLRKEYLKDVPDDLRSLNKFEQSFIAQLGGMGLEELLEFVVPIDRSAVGLSQRLLFPYEAESGRMYSGKKIAKNFSTFCHYLAANFPWHPHDAARFLLTGERPELVPLELSYQRPRGFFTLNFAPWISEKTFRKAYRKCQKVVQGGDNRRMQERTLAVMRFVTKHTDDEGNRSLPWSQLTELWNKKHPGEWKFKDRFGLRKTYLRAEEELAGSRR